MGEFGGQRQEATTESQGVIADARRQAAEIMQGIQARYGGTTGTGKFQSEVVGGAAVKGIASVQAALQGTMGKITAAENNLKTQTQNLLVKADTWLKDTKLKLKSDLDRSLAEISRERGNLEIDKGKMRLDALQQYQQVLADTDARNTQFKQQMYMDAQNAQQQIDLMKAQAQEDYQLAASKLALRSPITNTTTSKTAPVNIGSSSSTSDEIVNPWG